MWRYMLFMWLQEHPSGGFNDFAGSYATLESACKEAKRTEYKDYDWHVVDGDKGGIISSKSEESS